MAETKQGRPSSFNQETADTICFRLSEGETLTRITRDDGMPAITTIYRWLEAHPDFQKQYAHARDFFYQRQGDSLLDISDDGTNDYIETDDGPVVNHEHIQRSRLRVDTRKWLLSKMLPKLYGDKQTVEHTGKDGGPIKSEHLFNGPEPVLKPGELERLAAMTERVPGLEVNGNGKH